MPKTPNDETYSEEETKRRADAALKRMLPLEKCFSFAYSTGTGRYSFDVMAESQEHAKAIVAQAICEGAVSPT